MTVDLTRFHVGPIPIRGGLILAPMDGFSDLPFRSICRALGSAISVTAFVSAQDLIAGSARAWHTLRYLPEERPVAFQIFDSSPERLLEAGRLALGRSPDILDINMGCSVRCVSGRGAGAGLLRDPEKIARIITDLSRELPIPVTAKIRLGWDDSCRNYLEVARAVEESGGAMLAVHARTRAQAYGGEADWDAIAAIKQAVSIPVVGNGDVRTLEDIDRLQRLTGCDAVMIGRAAMGNPWIFSRRSRREVSLEEVARVVHLHLDRMVEFHGADQAPILFRKHLVRYLDLLRPSAELRLRLLSLRGVDELRHELGRAGLPRLVDSFVALPAPAWAAEDVHAQPA
jgi:nifR3 family TIM-barrel protein